MNKNQQKNLIKEMKELTNLIHYRINKSLLFGGRKNIPLLPQPSSLVGGELKDYQLQTLAWLVELKNHDLNGILADDMGLGKTIQAISFLCHQYQQTGAKGKHLIVVPKNVLRNWEKQLNKWTQNFKTIVLPGTELEREQCLAQFVKPRKFDILIATYQSVKTAERSLTRIPWKTLIIDEAHSIKNDQTCLSQCLKAFKPDFKLLMTGTPLSNDLKELWNLFNFILPDIFKDGTLFERIEESVNSVGEDEEEKIKFQVQVAKQFKLMINPFLMRRCKSEINLGLKEKKEITLFTSLSNLQLTMYRNFLKTKSVYGNPDKPQYNAHIQLAKICLHPYIFSDIEDPQAPPQGEHLIENCGKLVVLDKLLKKLIKEKHKILIFSQFISMLKILEDYCEYRQYGYRLIDGSSSLDDREKGVQEFFTDQKVPIFLISTRAGGIGLNLVAADVVILYDLDWNPQMDKQAMDRAYRIGQKNNVFVFRLVSNNTVEERKLEVQKYKLIWDELVIQKGGLARIKNSEQKFEKLNFDKIAYSGAEQIFKVQKTFDDQTIEKIIQMGEIKDQQKTDQIRKKLQAEMQKYDGASDPYEGLQLNDLKSFKSLDYAQKMLGKKSQIQFMKSRRNPKQSKQSTNIFQPRRTFESFKFYTDEDRVNELMDLIEVSNEETAAQYFEQLNTLGFYSWSKRDYLHFIQACSKYGRGNTQKISEEIGTKTENEVLNYLSVFNEEAKKNKAFTKDLKKIEKKQKGIEEEINYLKIQEQFLMIPQTIFYYQNKPAFSEINRSAFNWLIANDIRKNGISFQESKQILSDIFPFYLKNAQKTLNSTALCERFFEKRINEVKNQSQPSSSQPSSISEKVSKRYNQAQTKLEKLEQKFLSTKNQLKIIDLESCENSDKTELKMKKEVKTK